MKKVLIIGHFWPYRGGSKRVIGLAKYFKEFGWEPIVLTGNLKRKPEAGFRYIENNYYGFLGRWGGFLGINPKSNVSDQLKGKLDKNKEFSIIKTPLKFIYRRFAEVFAYPDEDKYWEKVALESVDELFKKEKIDAVISIWPMTSHIIAKKIKEKYNMPWVADFPELWSQNCDYPYGFIRKIIDRKLELKTLESADIFSTISIPMEKSLEDLHKGKKVITITHGFDPNKINNPPADLTSKFSITYAGLIYFKKRDPLKILIAIKELILEKEIDVNDIEVRFYGPTEDFFQKNILKYELGSFVKQHGVISTDESVTKQRESQLLLSLNWEDKKEKGIYTGKIFEYLAARRPIISTGGFGSDVVEKLLKETGAGVYAATVNDIKRYLKEFYSEYKQHGKVDFRGNISEIDKYSHRKMAEKFAEVLNKISR